MTMFTTTMFSAGSGTSATEKALSSSMPMMMTDRSNHRVALSEILMHELAGHAEPRIMGNIGNAIDIENSIRLELSQKKRRWKTFVKNA